MITNDNTCIFQKIKDDFLQAAKGNLKVRAYAENRIDKDGNYRGWVCPDVSTRGPHLGLNLQEDTDRFLLFSLASAWSATGPWENAATLIYVIKNHCSELAHPGSWLRGTDLDKNKATITKLISSHGGVFCPRRTVTVREDTYPAIQSISINWRVINEMMQDASRSGEWNSFVGALRSINGLAPGPKRLLIKIPLILRELKCQNIFTNIPGGLCCVQDGRVVKAIRAIRQNPAYSKSYQLRQSRPSSVSHLISSSAAIFTHFGCLYDLPLFAVEDMYDGYEIPS